MCYRQSNMICFVFKIVATLLFSSLTYGVISFCRQYPDDITALKMADLYFTQASLEGSTEVTSEDSLLQVYSLLEKNLFSPYSKVCPGLSRFVFVFSHAHWEEPSDFWGSIRWECMPRCSNIDLFEASSYYTYKLCNNYCTMPDAWKLKCFRLYDIILVHTYFAG